MLGAQVVVGVVTSRWCMECAAFRHGETVVRGMEHVSMGAVRGKKLCKEKERACMESGAGWRTRGRTKPCTCPSLEGEKERLLGLELHLGQNLGLNLG